MGFFFERGDMLALAHLDHQGLLGCRRDQLGVGRHTRRDDVSLDVPQPTEGFFGADASVRRSRVALIELKQAGPAVVKEQQLASLAAEQSVNEDQQDTPSQQRQTDYR